MPGDAVGPRVLHVINGRFYGGGHRSTLLLMDALENKTDVRAQLCTLGEGGNLPLRQRRPLVLPYDGRYNNPRVLLATAACLRRTIDAHDPDILHTHGLDADLIGGLALRGRRRTRHVSHLRITPPRDKRESWKAVIRRRLFRHVIRSRRTWFIAVSEAVRQQMGAYYRLPLARIVTVRNGIDMGAGSTDSTALGRTMVDRPAGSIVLGTAARLEAMKGLQHLIEAAGLLRTQGLSFELRIAGAGSGREQLERQASALGLRDQVGCLGQVGDMATFYRGLDVFVLPSMAEGLPLVVLEAMACGRPIVATRVGGTPEAVQDGVEGFLVPPGDAAALKEALLKLMRDPQLRRRMGDAGRQRVEREFTMERVAAEVRDVYKHVLAEG